MKDHTQHAVLLDDAEIGRLVKALEYLRVFGPWESDDDRLDEYLREWIGGP